MGGNDLAPAMPWRGLVVALVIIALLVASLALLAGSGKKQLPEPFGLASTGLVAFEMGGDIVAALPDGSGRRTLIADAGFQFGHQWSPRGDRIAYWSAPSQGDPASLWVANSDGSDRHRVSGAPVPNVSDLASQVSWSPDDERLVFTVGGPEGSLVPSQLYVVNADGTDLHVIGEPTVQRSDPVWSPDGSLIAYIGQPLADPYSTTSTRVISPDGLVDTEVIPAEGGYEIANVDPSWSPDSRSIVVHTGGCCPDDVDTDTDISIARRDAAGNWSPSKLVSGSGSDYLPSFSNSGRQLTFLRLVAAADPPEYVVMVADADGSKVHSVSTEHIPLTTPCYSPDDRFIRVVGLGQGADSHIRLFPLDGSPPTDIPAPGAGTSAGCHMQRIAP
jgi:Tol biopolymer transport system component